MVKGLSNIYTYEQKKYMRKDVHYCEEMKMDTIMRYHFTPIGWL